MLAKKILKNLENGNYRVEYRERCDCRFDWYLNGKLDCVITSANGDCWIDNILIMDNLAGKRIATYSAYFGLTVQIADAEQEIVNAIKNSDAYQKLTAGIDSPSARNGLHNRRKRESLAKWLNDNKHLRPYVYYPCVSPNDYVCGLLVLPGYYRKMDLLWVPVHWYSKTAEEWADMLLQKDMGGTTRYDIGFELVNELYEIDYGWYNHRANTTVSHDSVRYFFVDLQSANNFLNTREPGGINCYELNKLTVDYDGMIAEIDCMATKWGPEAAKEARKNGNRLGW